MKCSAFIAASVDGYIATVDGGVEWLETAGSPEAEGREPMGDGGFAAYLGSVDCMIMGRHCMEKIASFNLAPEQWPYGDIPIFVLSKSLHEAPAQLADKVEMFSDEIPQLVARLESAGYRHAYIDGGSTITSFIKLGLLDEICVTQVPILLGDGLPLFGKISSSVKLVDGRATAFSNDFIQWQYRLSYAGSVCAGAP